MTEIEKEALVLFKDKTQEELETILNAPTFTGATENFYEDCCKKALEYYTCTGTVNVSTFNDLRYFKTSTLYQMKEFLVKHSSELSDIELERVEHAIEYHRIYNHLKLKEAKLKKKSQTI